MNMGPRSVPLLLLSAFALLGTGCSDRGSPKPRVAGIVFQEDQFFRLALFGMRDAARREGLELLEANSAGKPDKEIQLVNTYIAGGIDALVISPLSARASLSALERAAAKGITVVTYNTTVEGNLPSSYIESNQYELGASTGRAAKEFIRKHLGGNADVAVIAFLSQAPEQSAQRTQGFKDQIVDLAGVRIVAEQDAWLAEQAVRKVGDMLTANPRLSVVWAANEGGTVGAVMAVKNSGRAGSVSVFGTDMSEQLADFLLAEDGVLQAVTGQRPFEMGSLAVETAIRAVRGEAVKSKISLDGVLLTRERPEEIRAFRQRILSMSR